MGNLESARITSSASMSPELIALVENLKGKQGTGEEIIARETTLGQFLVQLKDIFPNKRVLCKGMYYGVEKHYPAVLTYDNISKEVQVFAPVGDTFQITHLEVHYFYSIIPYEGIAREVYGKDSHNSTI